MHIRGWTIFCVSILTLAMVCYLAWIARRIHRKVDSLDLNSDKSAMAEAKVAHTRIDRIDQELKDDRTESSFLRAGLNVIKGRLSFLMHKEISEELERQASREELEKRTRGPE